MQPFFEVGGRWRQDEHADDVRPRLFPQLLRALPVDVEQHVLPRRQGVLRPARAAYRSGCRTRWPIRATRSALTICLEFGLVDEQIIAGPRPRPGRIGRVVADTDIFRPGIRSISNRDSVVLPAPDGDDSTNISPRRSTPSKPWPPAVIVHSRFCTCSRNCSTTFFISSPVLVKFEIVRLGAAGIDLAVEFLRQEIEPPSDRTALADHLAGLRDMRGDPVQFFADIGLGRDHGSLPD